MEKPSRLFVPLAVAASLIPSNDVKAKVVAPSPDPAAFCEELEDAKGPNIDGYNETVDFPPYYTIRTIKEIETVMEDGKEVAVQCIHDIVSARRHFKTITQNATYSDHNMDGFPDRVYLHFDPSIPKEKYAQDLYYDGINNRGENASTGEVDCLEGQAPDICEQLGIGFDDFDAAITAGRKALGVLPTVKSPRNGK